MDPSLLGRRICIYGPSGSGKTTVGRLLGRRLGIPFVELDAIFHSRPYWNDLSNEEFRARVTARLRDLDETGWVFDGNYSEVRELILPRADSVVWLRLPWRTVYPRLFRRTISRMVRRELLWGVNRESFRLSFFSGDSILWWGIKNWRPGLVRTQRALDEIPHHAHVVTIRSSSHLAAFLQSVEAVTP